MHYIVDANNLAGKLGIIKEKDFDKKLIETIKKFLGIKAIEITLVFDGREYMGDRWREGNLTVVYAPKDEQYRGADDLIIELVKKKAADYKNLVYARRPIILVTDDNGLKEKIADLVRDKLIKIMPAAEFGKRLDIGQTEIDEEADYDSDRGLSDGEIRDINDELLKKWK